MNQEEKTQWCYKIWSSRKKEQDEYNKQCTSPDSSTGSTWSSTKKIM